MGLNLTARVEGDGSGNPTRYEAESASWGDGAEVAASGDTSGGQYLRMNGGRLTFTVNVPSAGFYTVTTRFSQTYDNSKTQNLAVNGQSIGPVTFPRTGNVESIPVFTEMNLIGKVKFNAGSNTIAITRNWGWVDIDYIEVSAYEPTPFNISSVPVNPNASANTKKMYGFLKENFGQKIISGVMTNELLNGYPPLTNIGAQKEVEYVKNASGKYPALIGFDFMHGTGKEFAEAQKDGDGNTWFSNYTKGALNLAEDLYNKGGIPIFMWHWRDPSHNSVSFYTKTGSHSGDGTDFDLAATLASPESANYQALIRDIDIVAGYLKQLADKDIPVLWRPLHEAAGGWFWWGAKGPAANKELWIIMYDRLTNYHGLDNLIWVWTCEESADALSWYPGDQYVDIVGRDYYSSEKSHGSVTASFENLKSIYGGKKIIALSENGSMPYPENLVEDGAGWSWFMPWYGDYTFAYGGHNSVADWNKIMNHDYVITLDEMPGWASYYPPPEKKIRIEIFSDSGVDSIKVINDTDSAISTKGLYITDDEDLLKWQMPAFIIKSGDSILIRSGNEYAAGILKRAYVNFNISEAVQARLIDASENIIDEYKRQ
jgi:mannan endo-1,4-beta-mannosidase